MIIKAGSASNSIDVQILDDTGLPVTGKTYSDFNTAFTQLAFSLGNNTADNTATSYVTLAAITTAWTVGGVKERAGGFYRVDIPDAMVATAGTKPRIIGEATGYHLIHEKIEVVAFDPQDANSLGLAVLPASAVPGADGGLPVLSDPAFSGVPGVSVAAINGVPCYPVGAGVYFPLYIASPTNITAGTIDTVVNMIGVSGGTIDYLNNLPTIPVGWIVANGFATDAISAAAVNADAVTKIGTGVWATTTRTLSSFGTLVADIWAYATRILTAGTNIPVAPTAVQNRQEMDANSTKLGADTPGVTTLLKSGTTVGADFVFKTAALANAPGGSSFAGINAVTFHVQDNQGSPVAIPSARITITQGAASHNYGSDPTTGYFSDSMDPATYVATASKPGYSMAPYTFTISTNPQTVVLTMIPIAIPAIPNGTTQAAVYCEDQHGAALAGVVVTWETIGPGNAPSGAIGESGSFTTISGSNGFAYSGGLPSDGWSCRYKRGSGPWVPFFSGAANTTSTPASNLGTP